ncbi:MAG: tRNA (adenosine(37)-N6)-threonylcarbamoyltransferase complex transferase subunit TsaD [Alphaproteobacteria bacterium]
MIILGIESSCDETACAIVNDKREILAHQLHSQKEHIAYGGVVPELAARSHLENIDEIIEDTIKQSGLKMEEIDAIAATCGPGLIGGVVVGAFAGKAMSLGLNKPFIAINHLEGHALCPRLNTDAKFPYLLLLVSGGHCQFLVVEGVGKYKKLGSTIDDALGEAFDKTAKMLGLEYPGGPKIEKFAQMGDKDRFSLPRPMQYSDDFDMSFSGLKTAVRKVVTSFSTDGSVDNAEISVVDLNDICASFQEAASDCLRAKLKKAVKYFKENYPEGKDFVISGGVAANMYIRSRLKQITDSNGLTFNAPPLQYCTDNGVMIAWAGVEKFRLGQFDDITFKARPRWPL